MAEINVSISALRAKAEELEQLNTTFKTMIGTLTDTEAALGGMWEGNANKAFHDAFTKDMVQLGNFHTTVQAYVNALYRAIRKYAQAERKNTEIARVRTYG